MASIFSKIIAGEIPCHKVAENDYCFAFLDINPNQIGHTLCVTKREEDQLLDLSEKEYEELMLFSRKVGLAIQDVVSCKRVGMSVIGLEVPHVHVHLIPLHEMADATFQSKIETTPDELAATAAQIAAAFQKIR
ncbi:MAG: HIT family protein [Flavobacteriaceae bacterium]